MKSTFFKSALFAAALAGVFSACINDDDYQTPDLQCDGTTLVKTAEFTDIPFPTNDFGESILTQYTEDDVIEAYVTSSDEGGNFFKTISFVTADGAHGFSVPVDVTSTFINFEPGRKVLIKLKNLYTDIYNDGKRIGAIFVSNDGVAAVGRLPESQYRDVLNRACQIKNEEEIVQHVSLLAAQNDQYINKLIEVDNVQFVDASAGKTYYDSTNDIGGATNHYLTDAFGNTMIFRTSSFANFAARIVPNKSGKVRGVMTKFGNDYQFMARTERDVMLTEDRFEPAEAFFTEDFQTAIDGTDLNFTGWVNFAEAGTKKWKEEVFSGNGYAELSSFGSGNPLNIAWLVTPAIDFSAYDQKLIQFKVAQHHLDVDSPDNSLQVLVSTDFDGTNVLAATWVDVTPSNLPVEDTAWYEFLTNNVDLSAFPNGNIYVAFKFIGSGTNTTLDGAFQIDDLKAFGQ